MLSKALYSCRMPQVANTPVPLSTLRKESTYLHIHNAFGLALLMIECISIANEVNECVGWADQWTMFFMFLPAKEVRNCLRKLFESTCGVIMFLQVSAPLLQ